jgi:hydroxypyruvate reductase
VIRVTSEMDLKLVAREIFDAALSAVDAGGAVQRSVSIDQTPLVIGETSLEVSSIGVYVIAIGKAAVPMTLALEHILTDRISGGLIVGSLSERAGHLDQSRWRVIEGAHPLPDESSLEAARAAFAILQRADAERAPVIFLISGGGSAMIEWPVEESISLADLREASSLLISLGLNIREINCVRRAFSAVKGGRLASHAPDSDQVSLIISDTGRGDEATVASGPTIAQITSLAELESIIERYGLDRRLPASVLRAIRQHATDDDEPLVKAARDHYVLLDNDTAINAAANEARSRGFVVEIADDIVEQDVEAGCELMLQRVAALRLRAGDYARVCLISGGEFSCPVRGRGVGGRNAETVLRFAMRIARAGHTDSQRLVILSAGTDGIDGNSPAAGAVADETTIARANELDLDSKSYLDRSDSFSFFNALGDAVVTGPTGTNVRDLRIVVADSGSH